MNNQILSSFSMLMHLYITGQQLICLFNHMILKQNKYMYFVKNVSILFYIKYFLNKKKRKIYWKII